VADVFDKAKRSEIMSKIRSKNTKAELLAFSYLRKQGIYFQKHYARAPGKPDIALPRKKKAVFIDSDFWHGRDIERLQRTREPDDYWVKKISGNITRDKKQRDDLTARGWQILVVWERDILRQRTRIGILNEIALFLKPEVTL